MIAAESLVLEHSAKTFGFDLDAGAIDRIDRFLGVLEVWNKRLRLTGERSRTELLRKHVVDSLACVALLPVLGPIVDVGAGAGFPGAVLACVRPDLDVVLLDARERPTTFLREVARNVPLQKVRVVTMRAEQAARDPSLARRQMLAVSRAVRLDAYLPLAKGLLAADGVVVAMQTPNVERIAAEHLAAPHGFHVSEIRDYQLPDGADRRLIVFR